MDMPRLGNIFGEVVTRLTDSRSGNNLRYLVSDAMRSALGIFIFQSESFLAYQRQLEERHGRSNAQTILGVHEIPSDAQIRNILDEQPPSVLDEVYLKVLEQLENEKALDQLRGPDGNLLVALDATEYFSSEKISCPNCSSTEKAETIRYHHSALMPAIVKPGLKHVLGLPPEFITPQDGHDKQDCENAAAKRWLRRFGPWLKKLGVTILGDDLYSRQPVVEEILRQGLDYILVSKPSSHKALEDYVSESEPEVVELILPKKKDKPQEVIKYRFLNNVPLRGDDKGLSTNWCHVIITKDGKSSYQNSWVTNRTITKENIAQITGFGRARWKVENENYNTLKTKGYHLEHNFGHGKKFLSSILASLNSIAFLFHSVLELTNELYQDIRQKITVRKDFFQHIKTLTIFHLFDSFDALIIFMIEGLKNPHPLPVFNSS